jgi:hypothetical protein
MYCILVYDSLLIRFSAYTILRCTQQGFLGIVKQIEMAPSSLSLEEITLCAGRKVMTLATIFH